jgi:glyoxylase-like metal-dependent hydrolase (beta-lactamase superfamily II)
MRQSSFAPAGRLAQDKRLSLDFDRNFDPRHGEAVPVAPNVRRVTVNNPSPFTFHGTNSYIVGDRTLAVIDPGPEDAQHLDALLRAIGDRPVSHILISHTHRDHSPLAVPLADRTGAIICAEGPHRSSRPLRPGETNPFQESSDTELPIDQALAEGEIIEGDGWALSCVLTPGHCANHACFALEGTGILFSADHVMGWSTSIVAPPDGSMADYMASIEKLRGLEHRLYRPGHGGPVTEPQRFLRGLVQHRRQREAAVLGRLAAGDETIGEMVPVIYQGLAPALHRAAALSVLAQLEDLVARGLVFCDDALPLPGSRYRRA